MLWKRRVDNHLFGPIAQRGNMARVATGPAMAQDRGACARVVILQKRVCALRKSNDTGWYYFTRLELCTKHPDKDRLHNGVVPSTPTHGDAALRR